MMKLISIIKEKWTAMSKKKRLLAAGIAVLILAVAVGTPMLIVHVVQRGGEEAVSDSEIITLGKPIFGLDTNYEDNNLRFVNDGSEDTVWMPRFDHIATASMPSWFVIDLEENYIVTGFSLSGIGAMFPEESDNNIRHFEIQIGTDGVSFRSMLRVQDNTRDVFSQDSGGFGRYIRVMIYDATGENGDELTRVVNFEAYGNVLRVDTDMTMNGVPVQNVLAEPEPRIVDTINPTEDIIVASYIATDEPYSLDPTGVEDSTRMLNRMVVDLTSRGGGTIFLPAGKYRITDTIVVHPAVSIVGDWKDPDTMQPGDSDYGTVIIADVPSATMNTPGLFRMIGHSGVRGITVFYPDQNVEDPVPYPFTFEIPGMALGDAVWPYVGSQTIMHVTMLNSYKGIIAGATVLQEGGGGGHGNHLFRNIKGTALREGLYLADAGDCARDDDITLNNRFWANAGPEFNPPARDDINAWTRKHGVGVRITDAEWENMNEIRVADYYIGILADSGMRAPTFFYANNFSIEDCMIGIRVNCVFPAAALQFTGLNMSLLDDPDAIGVIISHNRRGEIVQGNVVFDTCTFDLRGGTMFRYEDEMSGTVIQNSKFLSWGGEYAMKLSGRVSVSGNEFVQRLTEDKKAILIDDSTWFASFVGNTFTGNEEYFLTNNGCELYEINHDTSELISEDAPYEYVRSTVTIKPPRRELYVLTDAPTNGMIDATKYIQDLMDKAHDEGGGIVYLPPGSYRIETNITVPSNVELRGSYFTQHTADPKGTTLWVIEGKNTPTPESDQAAITVEANAGVRGISIYHYEYPNNRRRDYVPYPYAIRGNGANVYLIDIGLYNSWFGVDLSGDYSEPCDDFLIRSVVGCAIRNAYHVGNSKRGWIEYGNIVGAASGSNHYVNQFNRFGNWWDQIIDEVWDNLTAVKVGAVEELYMLCYGMYASNPAFHFYEQNGKGANALLITCLVDGMAEGFIIDATGDKGIDIVNTLICVITGNSGCNDGLHLNGGTVRAYGISGTAVRTTNFRVTGGSLTARAGAFYETGAIISGGEARLQGILYREKTAINRVTGDGVLHAVDRLEEFSRQWGR